jgi:multimeric flavodoxin WrbA
MADARLLVIWHSNSGATEEMVELVLAGARDPEAGDVEVRDVHALEASAAEVLWATGLILGTPAHFGYMSGALKHFFDTTFKALVHETKGLPYALFVKGNTDTDGAVTSVTKITTGLEWKEVLPPLTTTEDLDDDRRAACTELGQTMAAGLAEGIF